MFLGGSVNIEIKRQKLSNLVGFEVYWKPQDLWWEWMPHDASFLVSKVVSSFLDASAFPFAALAVWSSGLSILVLHKKMLGAWNLDVTDGQIPISIVMSSFFYAYWLIFTVRCTAWNGWKSLLPLLNLYSTCEKIAGDTLQRLPWNPLIYSWFSAMEGLFSTIEAAIDKSLCVHHGFSLRWQLWRLRHTVASIQTTPSHLRRWVTLPWKSPFDPRNFI